MFTGSLGGCSGLSCCVGSIVGGGVGCMVGCTVLWGAACGLSGAVSIGSASRGTARRQHMTIMQTANGSFDIIVRVSCVAFMFIVQKHNVPAANTELRRHATPRQFQHSSYVGMCKKTPPLHRFRQRKTTRNQKANSDESSLVVPQKQPHPHKETKQKLGNYIFSGAVTPIKFNAFRITI